jgi:hypothetical protein
MKYQFQKGKLLQDNNDSYIQVFNIFSFMYIKNCILEEKYWWSEIVTQQTFIE